MTKLVIFAFAGAFGVGTMVSAAMASEAKAQEIVLKFRVYTAGVHAVDAEYRASIDATSYEASATTKTQGLLDAMFEWRSSTKSAGKISDGMLLPNLFLHTGSNRLGTRDVKVEYAASGPYVATIKGSGKYQDDSKGPLELFGLPVDVMTALTRGLLHQAAGDNLCAPDMDVFTGKRRNTIRFEYLGPDKLKQNPYAAFSGEAVKCRLHYDRQIAFVEDWEKAQKKTANAKKPEKPKVLVHVWFSPKDRMGINVPVRIETDSRFGIAIVHLMEFTLDNQIKLAWRKLN